jgi:hypothetical protein
MQSLAPDHRHARHSIGGEIVATAGMVMRRVTNDCPEQWRPRHRIVIF